MVKKFGDPSGTIARFSLYELKRTSICLTLLLLLRRRRAMVVAVVAAAVDTCEWAVSRISLTLFPLNRRLDSPQILLHQEIKRKLGLETQPTSS
jgi:hypothetical protein